MVPEDLFRIGRVSAPAVSPDGRRVAYVVTTPVVDENRSRSAIHVLDVETGQSRQITAGGAKDTSPAWSPDGTRLVFLSDRGGCPAQLHVIDVTGGEGLRIANLPVAAIEPRWLPGGNHVVFMAAVPPDAPDMRSVGAALEERRRCGPRPRITEDRIFRFWDTWLGDGDFIHLFVADIESGEVRDLTPGMRRYFDLMDPAGSYDISPDGQELAFSANSTPPPYRAMGSAIYTVRVFEPGAPRSVSSEDEHHHDLPRYSPDGRWLVWGRQVERDFYADPVRLLRHDRESGQSALLTSGWDGSCTEWEFSRDGSRLFITAEHEQRMALYSLPIVGAEAPRLMANPGWVASIRPSDERLYFVLSSMTRPPEVASIPVGGGQVTRLTRVNDELIGQLDLPQPLAIRFKGAGGADVSMLLLLPPGHEPGRRHPLVQVIHGGPHGASGDDWQWRWNKQLFAARGWAVAMVNFHGSTGFGETFLRSIHGAQPYKPFDDIMASTDHLIAEGIADPDKLLAAGASYGGYLISWIAGHTDRFKALVNHAGVFDLITQWSEDHPYGNVRDLGAAPWDGPEAMRKIREQSPSEYSERFVTPMLVTHGELDFRVPLSQGLACYNIYKAKGLPAKLIVFPDENHWVLKPRNSLLWYREALGWLEKWLG